MDCNLTSIACQLERIADILAEPDYDAFWSTLLATVIGALVAAGIGLYVAWSERPQPFFRAETAVSPHRWYVSEGVVTVQVVLWNVGDGSAYDVTLGTRNGVADGGESNTAKLEPGASLSTWIKIAGGGSQEYAVDDGEYIDTSWVNWPPGAEATVRWQQPPQRGKVRRLALKIGAPPNLGAAG